MKKSEFKKVIKEIYKANDILGYTAHIWKESSKVDDLLKMIKQILRHKAPTVTMTAVTFQSNGPGESKFITYSYKFVDTYTTDVLGYCHITQSFCGTIGEPMALFDLCLQLETT